MPCIAKRRHQTRGESRVWGAILDRVLQAARCCRRSLAGGLLVALTIPAFSMHTSTRASTGLPRDLDGHADLRQDRRGVPRRQRPGRHGRQGRRRHDARGPGARSRDLQRAGDRDGPARPSRATSTSAPTRPSRPCRSRSSGTGTDAASERSLAVLRDDVVPATVGRLPGAEVAVTGFTAGSKDFNDVMKSHLPLVFAFVLTLAFILLLVTFRSIVIPIKAIVLNLLSVGAAYGVLKLVFQDGRLEGVLDYESVGGITSWLPLFLFVILFGLSMDYHVFILSRIREAVDRGMTTEDAVAHGIKTHGGRRHERGGGDGRGVRDLRDAQHARVQADGRRPRGRGPDRRDDRPGGAAAGDDEAARRLELVPAEAAALAAEARPRAAAGRRPARRLPPGGVAALAAGGDTARMKMRAAVLEAFGEPLVVQEVELDEPKGDEVLVRLVACGVCHTDLYTASGVDPSGYAPCVLGHEGAGVVEQVGADVTLVAPGDHVVTLFSPQCGECVHCRSPKTNLCLAIREQQNEGYLPDGTTRLSRDGEPIRHFMGTSTFAEYTVMPEIALAKVNPEAPLEGAALFACGLSTGLGAAMQTAKVEAGLDLRRVRRRHGRARRRRRLPARRAPSGSSPSTSPTERLELARGQGATDVRVGGADTVEWILEQTGGFGADYTFEATGNVDGDAPGGRVRAHGLGPVHGRRRGRQGRDARRRPALLITGRRVAGSSFGGLKGREQVPQLIDRWLAGEIDVQPFLSHELTLDDVNHGFELMEAQDGIRSVIRFA